MKDCQDDPDTSSVLLSVSGLKVSENLAHLRTRHTPTQMFVEIDQNRSQHIKEIHHSDSRFVDLLAAIEAPVKQLYCPSHLTQYICRLSEVFLGRVRELQMLPQFSAGIHQNTYLQIDPDYTPDRVEVHCRRLDQLSEAFNKVCKSVW